MSPRRSNLIRVCVLIFANAAKATHADMPIADRFCAPIRSTFSEVEMTVMRVRGHRFRQQPNGGFGQPVVDTVDGQNLLHVGADLGWYQVGAPVYAVADGIVRVSWGPDFSKKTSQGRKKSGSDLQVPLARAKPLRWGNLILIEHRLPNGNGSVTTLYGHLATKRLVNVGDRVQAGQPIGTIGRKHARINGGYRPHLHFAVLDGQSSPSRYARCQDLYATRHACTSSKRIG